MAAAIAATSLSLVPLASHAAVSERANAQQPDHAPVGTRSVARSETCRDARRGLAYYTSRRNEWRSKMGQESAKRAPVDTLADEPLPCPAVRRAAKWMRGKAHEWRLRYERWYAYAWQDWLPDKFARVGACETGYGKRPGSWTWDSGTYVSAFGIYRPAYNQFAGYLGLAAWDGRRSPREQYRVAAAIQARFGWGAWGCGAA